MKRGLNVYPYCGSDPVNHADPTGEIANVLISGIEGGLIGLAAGFAGSAGSLLEQAISGERMNAGRGILGGLSNAVSGAIFGNVPFKNAGQAFGKGALSGAATSGLGYLSDLVGRQPKSGQMRHFPGGTVARTPYERLTDPRGICVQQDIFGGGLGIRKAYGYRYEMRDPDQPVREGFNLGDFLRSMLIGALMGGLSGVAFYGMGKAVEVLKGSLSGCRKNSRNTFNPQDANFMQNSIKNQTGEYTVLGNVEALKNGTLHASDLPEIRIWKDSYGKIWTLDHRRLAAFRLAELDSVPFRWATDEEIASQIWKMTTKTNGTSIKLKLGNGESIIIK